jgi:hypothetical protein
MKRALILLLGITTLTLAVVCVVQFRKSTAQRTQLASVRGQLEAQSQQVEDLQAAQKRAERQRRELAGRAEDLAAQLAARQLAATNVTTPAPTNPPPATTGEARQGEQGGVGKMLSSMMQDPQTRKFIRQQQRMMMDQMYAPLVKKMGLTPEEATQFKRARTILSPDQLATLGRFQTNQMQMMRVGMSMAKKMFAPEEPSADSPPPGQQGKGGSVGPLSGWRAGWTGAAQRPGAGGCRGGSVPIGRGRLGDRVENVVVRQSAIGCQDLLTGASGGQCLQNAI